MTYRTMVRLALVAAALALPLVAAAETYGGCFRVDLASPFILPDGSEHAPGVLAICTDPPLNPSAGTHRMAASGTTVGRLISRRVSAEIGSLDRPQVVFSRASSGDLRLIGYLEPTGGRVRAYAFDRNAAGAAFLAGGSPGWVTVTAR